MSVNIKQSNGSLKKIAGNTILLDATASEIREGTWTNTEVDTATGDTRIEANVTFEVPMPDTDYMVVFDKPVTGHGESYNYVNVSTKSTTGFTFYVMYTGNLSHAPLGLQIHWYAVRLVKLDGYTALQNKVNNPDSTPTEDSTNLVTSGGVYDAIKNASSVFIGTSAEWESETSKTDYQVAILTDKPNVNAVDSTTGDIEVVANKHLVFKGTLEEWEALTTAEKKTYDEALITNDMDTGEVVNGVTDGDMRAVTSNAVYDAITDLTPVDAVTNGNMKPVTSNAVADSMPEYYNKQLTVTAYEAAQLSVNSAYLRGQKVVCKDGKTRIFGKIILSGVGNPNGEINRHPCKLTGFPGLVTLLEGRLPCLIWSGWTGFYSMDNLATGVFAPIIAGGGSTTAEEACFTPVDVVVEITD